MNLYFLKYHFKKTEMYLNNAPNESAYEFFVGPEKLILSTVHVDPIKWVE